MTTKEMQENVVESMKEWQKVENASAASTGKIIENTDNPVVRLIMEIIQHDSNTHYRVEEFVSDSMGDKMVSLTPEEMGDIWMMIEQHIELEKKMVTAAERLLESMRGKFMVIPQYLIEYLLEDEKKHSNMLDRLQKIKIQMYPYG